jgi:LAO/AO transport system kinase
VRYFRNTTVNPISKIGVVAVDPSSPFSGGAILGDRIRMRDLAGDPGVFIRSMASRGTLGGLATATSGIVQVLDAAGFEMIFIETVGAGQAEVDIARLAHTTLVVEAPGLGDDIQAIKAGILEIADILVVNKADRPGVESTERALQGMLQLAHPVQGWIAPIQRTVATTGDGVSELAKCITQHYEYLQASGELYHRDRARIHSDVEILLRESLLQRWRQVVDQAEYENTLGRVFERQISPWEAVEELINGGQ